MRPILRLPTKDDISHGGGSAGMSTESAIGDGGGGCIGDGGSGCIGDGGTQI